MKNFWLLLLIAMVVVMGCGGEDMETGDILGEKISQNTNLIAAGELRKVAGEAVPGAPALEKPKEVKITYWKDWDFEKRILPGAHVPFGTTVYTKVEFAKGPPIVYADDETARPRIFNWADEGPVQCRMRPGSTPNEELKSGEAKPWGGTDHIFLCRYDIPEEMEDPALLVMHDFASTQEYQEAYRAGVARYGSAEGRLLRINNGAHRFSTKPGEFTYVPGEKKHTTDLVGQVVALFPKHGEMSYWERQHVQAVPRATVTVVSGPRAGEEVFTDRNGYYRFSKVKGNKLHLRVEKEFLEPKEVIVRRSSPTTLPNGIAPSRHYQNDPQQHPGVILMGLRWPDKVHSILEKIKVEPDLLYSIQGTIKHPETGARYSGFYRNGVVVSSGSRGTTIHEIGHAHQHAIAAEIGKPWERSWEAQSYKKARKKDWEEVGVDRYDRYYYSLRENFAETFALWSAYHIGSPGIVDKAGRVIEGLTAKDIIPNRFRWMENHTWK